MNKTTPSAMNDSYSAIVQCPTCDKILEPTGVSEADHVMGTYVRYRCPQLDGTHNYSILEYYNTSEEALNWIAFVNELAFIYNNI